MDNETKLTTTETTDVTVSAGPALGFEDSKPEDIIIPRVKVINALSPERIDGDAQEGDILNSLTKEKMTGKRFIPVKQYYSNIWWNPDRNADTRIFCRSADGRIGQCDEGMKVCAACKKNQFDNTKTGKEAQPTCTSYINFLGYFEGSAMPVILSFAKTNYNEGKKLLSIAKSMRCSIWNYAYVITSKKITKDRNTWYNMIAMMTGETSAEERKLGYEIYKAYENVSSIKADYEENADYTVSTGDAATEAEI